MSKLDYETRCAMQRKRFGSPGVTKRAEGEPPQVGDIQRGKALGRTRNYLFIYHACAKCGKLQWKHYNVKKQGADHPHCNSCARQKDFAHWQPKRHLDSAGYVVLNIPNDHPYRAMAGKGGRIREHRLIMAEHLGRCLTRDEEPHHQGNGRADNRIQKLELRRRYHGSGSTVFSDADRLEAENYGLTQEIKWLKSQIQEVTTKLSTYQHQTTLNI